MSGGFISIFTVANEALFAGRVPAANLPVVSDIIAGFTEMMSLHGLGQDEVDGFWIAYRNSELRRGDTFLEHCRAIMSDKAGSITAEAIASAKEIAAAINALPVGKDIYDIYRAQAKVTRYVDSAISAADQGKSLAEQQLDELKTQAGQFIDLNENVVSVREAIEKLTDLLAAEAALSIDNTSAPTAPAAGNTGSGGTGNRDLDRFWKRFEEFFAQINANGVAGTLATHRLANLMEDWDQGGGMGVRMPKCEVINDLSGDVANMFRIAKHHLPALLDELAGQVTSRAEFMRQLRVDPSTLTDIQRAARFILLQRLAFGGHVRRRTFGVSRGQPGRLDLKKLEPMLGRLQRRLSGVVIEQLPYGSLIQRYDMPGALFYLDPPYHGNETDYGAGVFSEADFDLLRGLLETSQGRFIMSINDTPMIREIFSGFAIEEVGLNYRVSGKVTPARELIITR